MSDLMPFSAITHLFSDFESTARRLETRRGYAVDINTPKWKRWKAGGDLGYNPRHPWHANVREQTTAGKRFERVRILDQPPTEGQRFLFASGAGNIEAGEDIRNLWRADVDRLGLSLGDFWLFDQRLLVLLVFDDEDRTLGVRTTENPAEVARAAAAWESTWPVAIPTLDFAAQVPSTV